jgi:hypothetical protein
LGIYIYSLSTPFGIEALQKGINISKSAAAINMQ